MNSTDDGFRITRAPPVHVISESPLALQGCPAVRCMTSGCFESSDAFVSDSQDVMLTPGLTTKEDNLRTSWDRLRHLSQQIWNVYW